MALAVQSDHRTTPGVPPCRALGLAVPKPAGDATDRTARGGNHLARPRGHLAHRAHPAHHLLGDLGGRRRALRRRDAPRPLPVPAARGRHGAVHRPRVPRTDPAGRIPARAAAPAGPGSLSDRGEPANGTSGRLPGLPAQPPGARGAEPVRPGTLPDRGQHPGRGLLPGPADRDHVHPAASSGWRPWCGPAARRISARWNVRAISRSRPRSFPPAATWTTTGSAAPCTGGPGPMGGRPSPTCAATGRRRTRACIPGCVFAPRRRRGA